MAIGLGYGAGLFGYDAYKNSGAVEGSGFGTSVSNVADPDKVKKAGHRSSPEDCETCKNRKYQDGSDEMVSFKAASHISPEAAPARVRGHEQEHVSNAYKKAAEGGGQVVQASVAIHTAVCPECGRTYVSGGVTSTVIKYPKGDDQDSGDKVQGVSGGEGAGGAADKKGGRGKETENFDI